jgi:hypothetical protein
VADVTADLRPMRCPTCDEVVDRSMALLSGRDAYLLCWNGHRFGLDGVLAVAADAPAPTSSTPTAFSRSGASLQDGAAG